MQEYFKLQKWAAMAAVELDCYLRDVESSTSLDYSKKLREYLQEFTVHKDFPDSPDEVYVSFAELMFEDLGGKTNEDVISKIQSICDQLVQIDTLPKKEVRTLMHFLSRVSLHFNDKYWNYR